MENAAERAQALPAGRKGYVGDAELGIAQQRDGLFDPARQQIAVRRKAKSPLEGTREIGLRDPTDLRQPADRPGLVRGGIHAVFGAQQTAQQGSILQWLRSGRTRWGCRRGRSVRV
ncbi:hypothetical protein G6F65_021267 [Rhizopus arrhizus]|nr:hypothetical protein G6F65_021267 [Rhizopus arrhizus]